MKNAKTAIDYIYNKSITCPVCKSQISVTVVRSSLLRLVSRDTDSRTIYKDINPTFYDVWLCIHCGFASMQSQFTLPLKPQQIEAIKKSIGSRWQPRQYPAIRTLDTAIEMFKLAIYNALIKEAKSSEIAMLCLKIGWLYREKADTANEIKYLAQACREFEKAFLEEDPPVFGMDSPTQMYLIGELSRRIGKYPQALKWFGEVLVSPQAKKTLKDKTRDQKDLLMATTNETPNIAPNQDSASSF